MRTALPDFSNSAKTGAGLLQSQTSASRYVTRTASGLREKTNLGENGVKVQQYSARLLPGFTSINSLVSTSDKAISSMCGNCMLRSVCSVFPSRHSTHNVKLPACRSRDRYKAKPCGRNRLSNKVT